MTCFWAPVPQLSTSISNVAERWNFKEAARSHFSQLRHWSNEDRKAEHQHSEHKFCCKPQHLTSTQHDLIEATLNRLWGGAEKCKSSPQRSTQHPGQCLLQVRSEYRSLCTFRAGRLHAYTTCSRAGHGRMGYCRGQARVLPCFLETLVCPFRCPSGAAPFWRRN